eukprot:6177750-Pleurochrysis_carterae.AAC.1
MRVKSRNSAKGKPRHSTSAQCVCRMTGLCIRSFRRQRVRVHLLAPNLTSCIWSEIKRGKKAKRSNESRNTCTTKRALSNDTLASGRKSKNVQAHR